MDLGLATSWQPPLAGQTSVAYTAGWRASTEPGCASRSSFERERRQHLSRAVGSASEAGQGAVEAFGEEDLPRAARVIGEPSTAVYRILMVCLRHGRSRRGVREDC